MEYEDFMLTKKQNAHMVLIALCFGFILTINSDNIFIKVLNGGFLAGIIGGLADWFAITALFRKPLGFITFRSEILQKNRERITEELTLFLGRDLLNTTYITKELAKLSLTPFLASLLKSKIIRKDIIILLKNTFTNFKNYSNTNKLNLNLDNILLNIDSEKFNPQNLKDMLLRFLKDKKNISVIVIFLSLVAHFLKLALKNEEIKALLGNLLEDIKGSYAKDNFMRNMAIGMMDLDEDTLAEKLGLYLDDFLFKLQSGDNLDVVRFIQLKIYRYLRKNISIDNLKIFMDKISHYLNKEQIEFDYNMVISEEKIERIADDFLDDLAKDTKRIEEISEKLKKYLVIIITDTAHIQLNYLREEIDKYTNEEIVDLVEDKVGDDLQMIRLNGSLVGFLVGIILSSISILVESWCIYG